MVAAVTGSHGRSGEDLAAHPGPRAAEGGAGRSHGGRGW